MKKSENPVLIIVLSMAAVTLLIAQFSMMAYSQGVQIISASPGQTIAYQGHGSANGHVTMEVSATINVSVGSDNRYYTSMNGVNIPGGSNFSITASPVRTFSVSGGMYGIGMTIGSVSGDTGSASMSNVPGGIYDIVVTGISNGSSVSMTVHAYQSKSVGSDGTFTASISTSGLPPAVYSVKQDNVEVAKVYLGVDVPATPTPTPIVTPAPTPTSVPEPSSSGSSGTPTATGTLTSTAGPDSSITATPDASTDALTPEIFVTSEPPSSGINSLLLNAAMLLGAVVIGLIIGYIVVFVILKK